MDTIAINVEFKGNINLGVEGIRGTINSIVSPYGFTYCDFKGLKKTNVFGVKVSYPRFFAGTNARLVESNIEIIEVNRHLVDKISWIATLYGAIEVYIDLIRVDIPFTYFKSDDVTFSDYKNIFGVLAMIYNETKKPGYRTKEISDMIDMTLETANFYDKANIAVCIYNQYLNIKRKTNSLKTFNRYNEKYPKLRNRIRIEVRQRIRRKAILLNEFADFDILKEYSDKYRRFLLKYLFDKNKLEIIKERLVCQLDATFKNYIANYGQINYVTWLNKNQKIIYDYSIVREVLKRNISNPKTLESAITTVRKELKLMGKTLMGCFDIFENMRRCIKNYKFNFTEFFENVEVEETIQMREYCIKEELDCIEDVF